MWFGSRLDRFAGALVLCSLGIVVSGTKACQEDYDFAAQSTTTPAATATLEVTATLTATTTPTPTPTIVSGEVGVEADNGLLQELSKLDSSTESAQSSSGAASNETEGSANWLGAAFSKGAEGSWQDSDGDGYSDATEDGAGSEASDASSIPKDIGVTRLEERVRRADIELAGEREVGEVDSDGDGISDETEKQRNMNPNSSDSDQDGLLDDRELLVGTNPLQVDSDDDGISDGREFEFGSDPTIAEPKKSIN